MAKRTGGKYQAIIEAAVRVIAQQGYHNAQVSKIAKEAGVADGTIYVYFENKDDVLISVFSEKMGQFIEVINNKMKSLPSVRDKLYCLVSMHFGNMAKNRDFAVVTQIELRQSNPVVQEGIGQTLKKYFDLIDQLIVEGKEEGLIPPHVDNRLARKMIFGTLDQVVTAWIMKGAKYDLVSNVDPVFELLLYGLTGKTTHQVGKISGETGPANE